MHIRFAEVRDIKQLIQMRWDFTVEFDEEKGKTSIDEFESECQTFLENGLSGDQRFVWVAEEEHRIVSHIFIELIQKVPSPGRKTYPFAYMTNVYTIPEYRDKGVGGKLLTSVNSSIKENNYVFVMVWPSDEAVNFDKKNGYVHRKEPMEYFPS